MGTNQNKLFGGAGLGVVVAVLLCLASTAFAQTTIEVTAAYCANATEAMFSTACLEAAMDDLVVSTPPLVLSIEPGTWTGACPSARDTGGADVVLQSRVPGSRAILDCQGDDFGLSFTGMGGTFTMTGIEITNVDSVAVSGNDACLIVDGQDSVVITDSAFRFCSANVAGAIWTADVDSIAVTGTDFVDVATSWDNTGAAISAEDTDPTPVTITNCTFTRCTERCLRLTADATIDASTFEDHSSGAVEVVGSIVLEVSGSTFSNVRAPKSGAGILFGDGTGGRLTITDSAFSGCEASELDTRGACVFSTTATTVDSTSFANCMSYGSGGCLAVANAVANHVVNNVTATNATTMHGWGGFAHFNALDMDIHHTTVTDCESRWGGGGMYFAALNARLSHLTLRRNRAREGNGGGMTFWTQRALREFHHLDVSDCHAELSGSGGGLFVDGRSPAFTWDEVGNITITRCSAGRVGGGLAVAGSQVYRVPIPNLSVTRCSAAKGGGLYTSMMLDLNQAVIEGNYASEDGGGAAFENLECLGGLSFLTNSHVSNNTCAGHGGGILVMSAALGVADSNITFNTGVYGGGIAADCIPDTCALGETICSSLSVELNSTAVDHNTVTGSGGGVCTALVPVTGEDSTIQFNHAGKAGGGVYVAEGTLEVFDATVIDAETATAPGFSFGGNIADDHGVNVAGPARVVLWKDSNPPLASGDAMSGQNLCVDGCVIGTLDVFGQEASDPLVVEVGLLGDPSTATVVNHPVVALIQNGWSPPMTDLRIRLLEAPTDPSERTTVFLGLKGPTDDDYVFLVSYDIGQCAPGYGTNDDGNGLICVECENGTFSSDGGFGPCTACAAGLTTSATGSTECDAEVVVPSSGTPWWVWLLIFVFVVALVAGVGYFAWKQSRSKVISTYYIDEDATVNINEKHLAVKVDMAMKDRSCKRIGGGVFTDIYRVRDDKDTSDIYCIKLLKVNVEGSQQARREFEMETRILAMFQARVHPGIIRARFFTTSSPVSIALDYCSGGTLKDFLSTQDVSPREKLRLSTQIASSMAYIHSKRVAHLDLKTTNILLNDEGNTIICDFGISQVEGPMSSVTHMHHDNGSGTMSSPGTPSMGTSDLEMASMNFGTDTLATMSLGSLAPAASFIDIGNGELAFTPQYCAPERLQPGANLSFDELLATDVFTYGVVVWTIYTQTEPYAGQPANDVIENMRNSPDARLIIPSHMDRDVTAVLHEMWSTDAAARPMFEEVRDRLGAVWTGKPFHGEPNAAYIDL